MEGLRELGAAALFGLVAFFYAMVGHGGASGYLAVGALLGQPLAPLKAQALVLNLGVAGTATWAFARSGWLRRDLLLPLIAGSAPFAFLGARLPVGAALTSALLSVALLFSALRLLWHHRLNEFNEAGTLRRPPWPLLALTGALLGLAAGMTGVGGGIYLSPVLLLLRWADIKSTAAVSAAFIVINSAAALAGLALNGGGAARFTAVPALWLFATLVCGALGARIGAGWLPQRRLAQALALVLILAAIKLSWPFGLFV